MKAKIIFIALFLFLSSCVRQGGSNKQEAKNDSTRVIDSNSTVGSKQVIKTLTYEQREGKFLYTKYCSVCHGAEGKGDGFNAFNLDPKPKDFSEKQYMQALTDLRLIEAITQGGRAVNKSQSMPAWGGRMTKLEIEYVVAYVRTFGE
jgi:cytochrome c oxidase cbb3-type subunit 3